MVSLSRRRALAGGVALLAGLSGCSGSGVEGTDTATVTERSYERSVSDPSAVTGRNRNGEPAVRSSDRLTSDEFQGTPAISAAEHWAVSEPGQRDALTFDGARNGGDEARTFAAETDLSTATLIVHQYYVDSCRTRELDRLEWGAAGQGPDASVEIDLSYDVVPYDGVCDGDGLGPVEATLFRIPDTIGTIMGFGYMA
jgi:hypothetical protein